MGDNHHYISTLFAIAMPTYVDYDNFMISQLHWNIYLGPLLLCIGVFLQVYCIWRKSFSFYFALVGALMIAVVAYVDSDLVLFLGQILILPFIWLQKK